MLIATLLLLVPEQVYQAGRYDMGVRLKALDKAWLATTDKTKRAEAVKEVSGAVMAFFSAKNGDACRALDKATSALTGKRGDWQAVSVRFMPAMIEPSREATLVVSWAYPAEGPVTVSVLGTEREFKPGEGGTIKFTKPLKEGVNLAMVKVGPESRTVPLSVAKDFAPRLEALKSAKNPIARDLAEGVQSGLGESGETTLPLAGLLAVAESVETGKTSVGDLREIHFARQDRTVLRAAFPEKLSEPVTAVIALHGAGGSENLFFEGYGGGLAVQEALKRGWVFLSPRASGSAAADSLQWLREVRGIKPTRVFVMGHSMGGGLALGTGALKPSAIAVFAPAATGIPANLAEAPIFLAVGAQEMGMLKTGASRMSEAVKKKGEFREYDPCEHLMIVADAVPDAYRFFDRAGK
ncbi:MAG: hypothetical protein K1X67_08795 [Fimbriimonadaceae bacterium]|nr:hypothetical protein [Fimbriimonadaceae bacterium]